MADEEPKHDVKPQVETIQISLQGCNGEQTHFKVKPTTKMGKIFEAYSKRQGVPTSTFRVILDGDRVNADDTPQSLGLENGDVLDVAVQQTGGSA